MADNDRFEFVKLTECKKCLYKNSNYCEPSEKIICLSKGKTRSEYINIIAESIFDTLKNIENNTKARQHMKIIITWEELKSKRYKEYLYFYDSVILSAKSVVDRLFGEGE